MNMKEISFSQLTRFALVPALILSMGTLPNGRAVAAEASGQSPPPARTEGTAPKPQAENPPAEAQVYGLDRLKVEGDKGDIVVSGEELRMNPSATGTVTEALRGASRVQFDYASRSGMTGGEITAPQISINGSRHYENNFTINGMGINNYISPAGHNSDSGFGPGVQPGGDAQSFFMDTDLLESVVVHTENISARYGDFLGGVVDAELRDARGDRWHAVGKVMHTRDQWAQQHYVTPPATGYSTTPNYQPRFSRWQGTLSADGPLPGKFGLTASYGQSYAEIPMRRAIVGFPEQSQHRRNQNFLARVNTLEVEGFKGAATFIYAPYDQQLFVSGNRNAEVWINGGGLSLMLEAAKDFSMGSWQNKVSWNRSNLSRHVNGDVLYQWRKYVGGACERSRKIRIPFTQP